MMSYARDAENMRLTIATSLTGSLPSYILPTKRVGTGTDNNGVDLDLINLAEGNIDAWQIYSDTVSKLLGDNTPTGDGLTLADYAEFASTAWGQRVATLEERLMVDLTEYMTRLAEALEGIEVEVGDATSALERVATAIESQQAGEGLEGVVDAIGALAPLVALI